jgi:hypothetical protein
MFFYTSNYVHCTTVSYLFQAVVADGRQKVECITWFNVVDFPSVQEIKQAFKTRLRWKFIDDEFS